MALIEAEFNFGHCGIVEIGPIGKSIFLAPPGMTKRIGMTK
jgi:hypothetical protein